MEWKRPGGRDYAGRGIDSGMHETNPAISVLNPILPKFERLLRQGKKLTRKISRIFGWPEAAHESCFSGQRYPGHTEISRGPLLIS